MTARVPDDPTSTTTRDKADLTMTAPSPDRTTARSAPSAAGPRPSGKPAYRITVARVIRSEWIKLRTLRSTWVMLAAPEVAVTSSSPTELLVEGVPAADIGDLAARHALPLHELVPLHPSLEEAFMELTKESVQYHGRTDGALLTADAVR